MGEASKCDTWLLFVYQALRHLLVAFTEAASIIDRPGSTEYAEYETAAFAEAAGVNDEVPSRQSPTSPHWRSKRPRGTTRPATAVLCSETPARA